MVAHGSFVLHDAVRPAVPDGAYQLTVTQELGPPGQQVDALDRHLIVTGPRFALPPDQTLSSYPPDNATGDFQTRLPQIVLRRRTLPWERYIDATDTSSPWLALVVLAEGEGQLTTGQPVDTAGLTDPDLRDSDTRDVLTVSERVVQQIFPTKQDLQWLCHVREVDLSDTELALGDDDGWLAVVLANRLPQPGLRYTACLVSLEGHGDDLPAKEPSQTSFTSFTVYTEAEISAAAVLQRQGETRVDDLPLGTAEAAPAAHEGAAAARAAAPGEGSPTLVGARIPATKPAIARDAWSAPDLPASVAAGQRSGGKVGGIVTGATSVGGLSIHPVFIDPGARLVQFTVLRHWTFTCAEGGDFESLIRGLDDGMLGTMTPPDPAPPAPGTPPAAPQTRPDPEVTDTGHVLTQTIGRRGDPGQAWYRGPLSPRQILRAQPDASGGLPLLHAADQARRVGPDGREDLSLAAAFEIGRLLAVSQPAVVAGLLTWRQSGYAPARVRSALNLPGGLQARLLGILSQNRPVFGAGVAATVVGALGGDGAKRLGPVRPAIEAAPPIIGADGDVARVVASGFGMDPAQVESILASTPTAPGLAVTATTPTAPAQLDALKPEAFAAAQAGLSARVAALVADPSGAKEETP